VQPQKRSWLYGGLAHPPGVALVRPKKPPVRKRLPPSSSLLVMGDRYASGLSPFLRELCRGTEVRFFATLRPATTIEECAEKRCLQGDVERLGPDMVIASLPAGSIDEALVEPLRRLAADVREKGATFVWLRPPRRDEHTRPFRLLLDQAKIPSFHSEALEIPRGPDGEQPTVRGYAGWAGALWRWIG